VTDQESAAFFLNVRHHLSGLIDQQPQDASLAQLASLADDRIAELVLYMKEALKPSKNSQGG